MRLTRIVRLVSGLVLALAISSSAQYARHYGTSPTGESSLWIDHAVFLSDSSDAMRLEVYYKIFNFGLTFERDGYRHIAGYEVQITVEDKSRTPVGRHQSEKEVILTDVARTKMTSDYRSSQAGFDLPPGKYKVLFILQDDNSDKVYRHEFDVKLNELDKRRAQLSDIEFVQHVEDAGEAESVFRKGDQVVVPSISRDYGGDENDNILFYIETYRPERDSSEVLMETIISRAGGSIAYRDTMSLELGTPVQRHMRSIPVIGLTPGDYLVEVVLRGRRYRQLDRQQKEFKMLWSQEALLKHDFKEAISQLKLIAFSGELKPMQDLEGYEERLAAFDQFWRERDPTPETPRNEVKIEFYRRINYANQRFRFMRQSGWSTDRGRIYVEHGEPDQVEDVPMSHIERPYQIWHYYEGGPYLRFVFIDEDLDGDFRLQPPYDGKGMRPDF